MAHADRYLKVVGICGTLRDGSSSLGGLVVEFAGRFSVPAERDLAESAA
ncbi:MAG TPA: hypothetical protein VF206_06685 [Rubrobacter sp.]